MIRKIITIMLVMISGGMLLGAGCQSTGESLGQIGGSIAGLGGLSSGNSQTDSYIKAGALAVEAGATMDPAEQELVGQTIAVKLASSPGLVDDAKLNDYVTKVGLTIVSVCGRSDIDFTFGILNGNEVNAISAPRGYVFVTRGAIARMQDESELAAVLAHEIGHVVKDHGMEAVRNSKAISAGLTAGAAAANRPLVSALADVADNYKGVLYNPNQETDADKLAVQYLAKAGYDPGALARFVERVQASAGDDFTSHPPAGNRVASLRSAVGANPTGQRLPERFAANVKK